MNPSSRRTRLSGLGLCLAVLGGATAVAGLPAPASAASTTPGAPSIRSVRAGDGKLVVSLKAPSSNGGSAILGYVVTATAGSQSVSTNTSSTTATVNGLTDGVTYTVTAKALNANGLGPASSAAHGTPIAGPVALTMVSSSPTFVTQNTRVTYSGTLTRTAAPLSGEPVFLTENYSDDKQVTLGQTVTDAAGHYAFITTPVYNGTISVSASSASASLPIRVLVTLTTPKVTARHGRSITVVTSSAPGFVTGVNRAERAQLQSVDRSGRVHVLATAAAAQRVGRRGYTHGVNDITFRVQLPSAGAYRLVVKVLGTPVNTGATSKPVSVTVTA